MSFKSIQCWLEKSENIWPPKNAKWIESNEVQQFLSSYSQYRQGHSKGAKGDLEGVVRDVVTFKPLRKPVGDTSKSSECQFQKSSIFETVEDPVAISQLHELQQYRQAYRRFRTGSYRGAEGEISKLAQSFTRDQLRLLPVAAFAQYLDFRAKPSTASSLTPPKFHLHFGAGKLGLGLILPCIVSGSTPFAIYQRPSDEWSLEAEQSNLSLDVFINEVFVTSLSVIRSLEDLQHLHLMEGIDPLPAVEDLNASHVQRFLDCVARCNESSRPRLLILCEALGRFFMLAADSFSCSLGPALYPCIKALGDLLKKERPNPRFVHPVYGCENDHTALKKLRSEFDGYLAVRECMVDRICSDRIVAYDKIYVTAEPYTGELVISPRPSSQIACAFSGPNVLTPYTLGSYSYLYNRKFFIVNGTHTTFAFMTLRKYCTYSADAPGDFPLMSYDEMTPLERLEIKAWAVARCLLIFHNHDIQVIKYTHGLATDQQVIETTWAYAEKMIERLSSVKDSTKRVLGGGVANRYKTRLKDVLETLETFRQSLPFSHEIFSLTHISSIEMLIETLKLLVTQAERFVTLRPSRSPYLQQEISELTRSRSMASNENNELNQIKGYHSQFSTRLQR